MGHCSSLMVEHRCSPTGLLVTFDTAEEMKATELSAHMVELQCLYGKLSPGNCTDDTC